MLVGSAQQGGDGNEPGGGAHLGGSCACVWVGEAAAPGSGKGLICALSAVRLLLPACFYVGSF